MTSVASLKARIPYLTSLPRWEDFLKERNYKAGHVDCFSCDGKGEAYDPADRDIYEGYKLADKKECRTCRGSGRQTFAFAVNEYQLRVERFNKEINRYNEEALMCRSIRDKLTVEEQKLINLYGPITILKEYPTCVTNFL